MYKLLFSYFNTALCSWMMAFLMPLILLDITNSPIYVSAAYAVGMLPYVVITPIAGVLGDSVNRKRIIQIGELFSGFCTILLSFVPLKASNAWLLLVFHFILSSTIALHHPVFQAMIPNVVSKERISSFNAYVSTIDHLINISAPALVGLCLLISTKKSLLYGISAAYLLSFGAISWLAYQHPRNTPILSLQSIARSVKEGFEYVWATPLIRYATLLFVSTNFSYYFFYASFMYHLKNDYLIPEHQLSYYLIPAGILSIIGALIAPSIIKRFADGKIIGSLMALEGCIFLLISLSRSPLVTAGLWGVGGTLTAIVVVTVFTMRQSIVPEHLLSRTVAFTRMIAFLAIPAGAISSGIVVKQLTNFAWIPAVSGTIILAFAIVFWKPLTTAPTDKLSDRNI